MRTIAHTFAHHALFGHAAKRDRNFHAFLRRLVDQERGLMFSGSYKAP